jgi:FkbM family methyltransferase
VNNRSRAAGALVLNVRGGARMCVPAALDQITPYVLLEQEDWFEDEIRFVRRWLAPGMRVVDVGACYGVYTVAAAQSVGGTGRVWAFEPAPCCTAFLQRALDLNQCTQVDVSRIAISDCRGNVPLALAAQPEMSAIASGGAIQGQVVQVPASTLDDLAKEKGWNSIDFVKLDVEGHEARAISGGKAFFAANSPLVMMEIKADRGSKLEGFELLAEMGYAFYRLLPGPLVLVPFDAAMEPIDEFQLNLFACKRQRASELAAGGFLVDLREPQGTAFPRDAWAKYAAAAPYARAFSARWPAKAGFFSGSGDRDYFQGLAAFAESRDPARSPAQRVAALNGALVCVERAIGASDSLARRLSHARLAWELGWRDAAHASLARIAERVEEGSAAAEREPFLAPTARYELLECEGRRSDWFRCAVLEQLEKVRAYSSAFIPDGSSLAVLESIVALPFRSPEVDRRWQLVRMAAGLQAAPEPGAQLCIRSEENLNPQYWCAAQHP